MKISARSLRSFARRYGRNRLGVFAFIFMLAITIAAVLPDIMPWYFYRPWAVSRSLLVAPNLDRPMGTDDLGRDVFSRFMYGARVTLSIGVLGALLSTFIGIFIGAISGYYGGTIDAIMMRIVDMLWIMPPFFVALVVVALLGASFHNVILIIGLLYWPSTARLMRAEMLSLREREFVSALKLMGMSNLRIVFMELLPNALSCTIANGTLQVASAILLESGVSFLGLGDPTRPTWGYQLSSALIFMREAWWMTLFPGLGIFLTTFNIHIIGDAINDVLNPRLRSSKR